MYEQQTKATNLTNLWKKISERRRFIHRTDLTLFGDDLGIESSVIHRWSASGPSTNDGGWAANVFIVFAVADRVFFILILGLIFIDSTRFSRVKYISLRMVWVSVTAGTRNCWPVSDWTVVVVVFLYLRKMSMARTWICLNRPSGGSVYYTITWIHIENLKHCVWL